MQTQIDQTMEMETNINNRCTLYTILMYSVANDIEIHQREPRINALEIKETNPRMENRYTITSISGKRDAVQA